MTSPTTPVNQPRRRAASLVEAVNAHYAVAIDEERQERRDQLEAQRSAVARLDDPVYREWIQQADPMRYVRLMGFREQLDAIDHPEETPAPSTSPPNRGEDGSQYVNHFGTAAADRNAAFS